MRLLRPVASSNDKTNHSVTVVKHDAYNLDPGDKSTSDRNNLPLYADQPAEDHVVGIIIWPQGRHLSVIKPSNSAIKWGFILIPV